MHNKLIILSLHLMHMYICTLNTGVRDNILIEKELQITDYSYVLFGR